MGEGEEEEVKKKKKKGTISEEDSCMLLQRYNATTILALLQEVSQSGNGKIDWKALVKRTSTGITSAREYQMLWRHLAYRETLLEKLEVGAEPVDDNSDVEFEVEAIPAISEETSLEAAACVKVLMSSGLQRETCPTSRLTVEAPLTINIPSEQISRAPPDKQQPTRPRGVDVMFPVSVQKHTVQTGPSADPDENGPPGSGSTSKKRRNPWTKEEDTELIAAVQKFGEGNWVNILKGEFKHNRTASQLSQRWSIIRKRQPNSKPSGANKSSNSTRSEERLAAQKAISLAIDMPMKRSLSTIFSGATQSTTLAEAQSISAPQEPNQSQLASTPETSQKGALNPTNKLRTLKKQIAPVVPSVAPAVPSACPSSSIQAVAFAAGGRIAAPSTAASLLKAAQSKSAVHIRPVGGAFVKSVGTQARHAQPVVKPPSLNSSLAPPRLGSQQSRGGGGRPAIAYPTISAPASNQSTPSETKTGGAHIHSTQENAGMKTGRIADAIDVVELSTEVDGGSVEMDLNRLIGQGNQKGLQSMDIDLNNNHAINTGDNKADVRNIGATGDLAMVIDAGRIQIPADRGICLTSEGNAAGEQLGCLNVSAGETKESHSVMVERHSDLECCVGQKITIAKPGWINTDTMSNLSKKNIISGDWQEEG